MTRDEHRAAQRETERRAKMAYRGVRTHLDGIGEAILLPDHNAARAGKEEMRTAYTVAGDGSYRRFPPKDRKK